MSDESHLKFKGLRRGIAPWDWAGELRRGIALYLKKVDPYETLEIAKPVTFRRLVNGIERFAKPHIDHLKTPIRVHQTGCESCRT